ncbi:MAG: hypothetical protein WKG07_13510 [Hymenobacter sp.]
MHRGLEHHRELVGGALRRFSGQVPARQSQRPAHQGQREPARRPGPLRRPHYPRRGATTWAWICRAPSTPKPCSATR